MTVLLPPPLPVRAIPVGPEAPPPAPAARARDRGLSRLGLVLMFLLCCALPIVGATLYVWHRDVTSGGGGLFAGGFFYMVAMLFVYLLALLTALFNCWHCVGGFAVVCAFACRGRVGRTSFWLMGASYGLLSGFLLLGAVDENIGPTMKPLAYPIPVSVATWVVPAVGLIAAVAIRRLDRAAGVSPPAR